MTKCVLGFMAAMLLAASFPASGWDYDKTRARYIMDRAANDGNATARLLVAMVLDERVDTIFDDYEFRLPSSKDPKQLYIQWLDHDDIYSNLMYVSRKHASKITLMVYALQGTFSLWNRRYGRAALYYRAAEQIGEKLIQKMGLDRTWLFSLTMPEQARWRQCAAVATPHRRIPPIKLIRCWQALSELLRLRRTTAPIFSITQLESPIHWV